MFSLTPKHQTLRGKKEEVKSQCNENNCPATRQIELVGKQKPNHYRE